MTNSQANRSITFVCDYINGRVMKLGGALERSGWRVTLLHAREAPREIESYCSESRRFGTSEEALAECSAQPSSIYHVFSVWNFDVAKILIENRPGKIVFDDFDVFAGVMDSGATKQQVPGGAVRERFCVENADGLCCRSLELRYLRQKLRYRFRGPAIFFPEYVWGDLLERNPTRFSDPPVPNSVVFAGNITNNRDGSGAPEYLVQVAGALGDAGFELHIYPSPGGYHSGSDEFEELDNVTWHSFVGQFQLIHELPHYTAALQIPNVLKRDSTKLTFAEKPRRAMASKIFDFLDAGLPTLVGDQILQASILRRCGALIPLDRVDPLRSLRELSAKTLAGRHRDFDDSRVKNFFVTAQIERLIRFYEAL